MDDSQKALIANLYGWIRPDGTRRYRTVFHYVGRGNAKSTMASGLGLYSLYCEQEAGKEIYVAAGDKEQAQVNVTVHTGANLEIYPSKDKSTEKIDGVVAAIMAKARADMNIKPTSVYATRGLLEIKLDDDDIYNDDD